MDNFDLKKYLAEGKLHEAEMQLDSDIEGETNKNDFAFWYRPGVRGKAQALKAQELLKQNGIDADYSKNPFYIGFSNSNVEQRAVMQLLRDAGLTNFAVTTNTVEEGQLNEENPNQLDIFSPYMVNVDKDFEEKSSYRDYYNRVWLEFRQDWARKNGIKYKSSDELNGKIIDHFKIPYPENKYSSDSAEWLEDQGILKIQAEGRLKETFVKLSDEQKAKVIAAAKRGEAPEDVIDSDFDGDDKYLQSVKALMDKSKLNEAMLDVTTTEKIAQAVADAFTAEDNELDLRYTVTPGTSERSFDLDVERGPNTPDEDSLGQDIENYLGDYAGGSFYIKDGVVYNAAMRNAPVANVTPEGEIEMISAEDSRDAIGMVDGEKTDYMERRREMSDYMEEGEMLDEGWKETLVGMGMAAASIAGIGKAMAPSPEALADKEQAELVVNAQQDALEKSSDEEINQMVKSLEDAGIQIMGTHIKIPPSIYDKYRDNPQELDKLINQEQRKVIQKLTVKGNDMVKSGFVVTSNGALQWANPSQITPINEEQENKPSNKMKKSKLKEMIKAAMLNEASEFDTNKPARIEAFLKSLDDLVEEYHAELYLNDDLFAAIEDVKSAAKTEMGGPVDDIPGFEGTMDALDSLSIREEKKEDKEEEEVEVEDEEIDVDLDQEEVDMDMDMDMEDRGRVGLTGDKKVVDDSLEAALEAARNLGDEKLVDQIGNTITFFTRSQIVKETINKEKMLQEVKRMQRIAGIIK